ncbi:MAG TPA: hypothetical protein VGE70_10915 [Burkholderiaceae bacterium]
MDGKKFLFLSRRQRWTISLGLGSLLAAALLGVVYAPVAVDGQVQRLGNVSADALKLLLTAAAGWVLVLLYTSSNSFGRIERETVAFLTRDLCRPSGVPGPAPWTTTRRWSCSAWLPPYLGYLCGGQ